MMTSRVAMAVALVIGTLFAASASLGAQLPAAPGGGVHHGYGPPAPHGGGQWPSVQHRPGPPPPARRERAPHPRGGHYWVPGHYAWRGSWVWAPGLWVAVQPGCGWVPPHWQWYQYGWVWLEGYWAC
jgi:hypothetical protein